MTTGTDELLACPHCGGAVALYAPDRRSETKYAASVVCHHCGVSVQMADYDSNTSRLIAAWNTRPISDGAVSRDTWRRMDTAPKDGNYILVSSDWPLRYVEKVRWIGAPHDHWSVDGYRSVNSPTHWQPLPAPPTTEAVKP